MSDTGPDVEDADEDAYLIQLADEAVKAQGKRPYRPLDDVLSELDCAERHMDQ